jgi:hypothetical protein
VCQKLFTGGSLAFWRGVMGIGIRHNLRIL